MASTTRDNAARLKAGMEMKLQACKSHIELKKKEAEEYEQLAKKVEDMPKKLTQEFMMPCGSVGYIPGRLVHTNELYVLLGENMFAERSAHQTAEILRRRVNVVRDSVKGLESECQVTEKQIELLGKLYDECAARQDEIEIREEYDEEAERAFREKRKARQPTKPAVKSKDESQREHDACIARLEELEKAEKAEAVGRGPEKPKESENPEKARKASTSSEEEEPEAECVPPAGVDPKAYRELLARVDALMETSDDEDDESEEGDEEEAYDSDDVPEVEEEEQEQAASSKHKGKPRGVHFPRRLEAGPSRPVVEVDEAEVKSILKNKSPTPVDRSKVGELEREASKQATVLPSSRTAFPGEIFEHGGPSTSGTSGSSSQPPSRTPPKRVSKFKQDRANH
ncbi:unnamed protein product, partial [Mesorhabditis spiculigera]